MLQRERAAIRLYIEKVANASERASAAIDQTTGRFHWRCNPSEWIWPPSRRAWIYSSILENFASACRPVIYVPMIINECRRDGV
jgi:hypothetical protein